MNAVLSFQIFTVFLFILAMIVIIQLLYDKYKVRSLQAKGEKIKILSNIAGSVEQMDLTIQEILESPIKDVIKRFIQFEEKSKPDSENVTSEEKTSSSSKEIHP